VGGVTSGLGPFDTPFEPISVTLVTQTAYHRGQLAADLAVRTADSAPPAFHTPILFLIDTSAVAAPYILVSGREVLGVGGFTGAAPSPTPEQIRRDIATRTLRVAIVPVLPPGHDPRMIWIRTHCLPIRIPRAGRIRFGIYDCPPAVAR
jgi:hypothetical protein